MTDYYKLEVGFQFPPISYTLESAQVSDYLEATRETNPLFRQQGLVPPMLLGAMALAALSPAGGFPPGTLHVSQEFDFLGIVTTGETITCQANLSRIIRRKGLFIMSVDLSVFNQNQCKVLTGKIGFALPEPDGGKN